MSTGTIEALVGVRIATARQDVELTQEELADRVGMAKQSISRLERGRQMPSLWQLERVASAVGLEMGELFRRRDSERRTRHEIALARVAALLRERSADEVERVADVLDLIFRPRHR